jgi:hypothetical protein
MMSDPSAVWRASLHPCDDLARDRQFDQDHFNGVILAARLDIPMLLAAGKLAASIF